MTLKEIYDKLYIMLVGEGDEHGYGVKLHNGVWDKEEYNEILKLIKIANETILASKEVNSEECVKVVNLSNQFFGDTLFYLSGLPQNEENVDQYIRTTLKLQTSFGVPYKRSEEEK